MPIFVEIGPEGLMGLFCKGYCNCDNFTKIGRNEGHTMLINLRPWDILGLLPLA